MTLPSAPRRRAFLTVDLEDYRRQELARLLGGSFPPHPAEVERQLDLLLDAFAACSARATFFTVGRLASELPHSVFRRLADGGHRVGCHGHQHLHVSTLGPRSFLEDLLAARNALEAIAVRPVLSFRAPYFSSDGCDPWFGEMLARAGFRLDSSRRILARPAGFRGTLPLEGSGGDVTEVPLPCVGFGSKRLTVIGGTYFRLLPLAVIRDLLRRAEALGFVPLVYLHPYDIDPTAAPLELPRRRLLERAGDRIRRTGRGTVPTKLRSLSETYTFEPVESLLPEGAEP